MRQLLTEPLVHFLAVGALLFLLFGLTSESADEPADRILVSNGDVERLSAQFARTWMRPPSEAELAGLIDGFVREEIYYREALALGLDRDDPLVRQRMRQKHQDQHTDLDTAADTMLSKLLAGVAAETLGDRIMLGHAFEDLTTREIAHSFGDAFAERVASLETGDWQGPIDSSLVRHIVQVLDRQPERLPALSEVHDRVVAEWKAERRRMRKEQAYKPALECLIRRVPGARLQPHPDGRRSSAVRDIRLVV